MGGCNTERRFEVLDNAKKCADEDPGYRVFDWKGTAVYPVGADSVPDDKGMANKDCPFLVKVSIPDLNIRKGAGTGTGKTGNVLVLESSPLHR